MDTILFGRCTYKSAVGMMQNSSDEFEIFVFFPRKAIVSKVVVLYWASILFFVVLITTIPSICYTNLKLISCLKLVVSPPFYLDMLTLISLILFVNLILVSYHCLSRTSESKLTIMELCVNVADWIHLNARFFYSPEHTNLVWSLNQALHVEIYTAVYSLRYVQCHTNDYICVVCPANQ